MDPTVIIVSALIAIVAAAVSVIVVVARYKNKLQSPIYPLDKYTSLSLSESRDIFIGKTVTRVRVNNNKK